MAADVSLVGSFEAEFSLACSLLEQAFAQVELVRLQRWPDDTGEGWEVNYNALSSGGDKIIPGGRMTKDVANNGMSSLSALRASWLDARGNVAKVAAWSPDRVNYAAPPE